MASYFERKDDRLLDVTEVADLLGMKTSWVYERTRTKTIPHFHLGKYVKFWESDVQKWLQEREVEQECGIR